MYCKHCGSSIDDKSAFCRFCGKPLDTANMNKTVADEAPKPAPPPQPVYTPPAQNTYAPPQQNYYVPPAQPKKTENTIAIVGFILSFLVPIAGLICSIIGFNNTKKGGDNKGLAIAGIVISAVSLAVTILYAIGYLLYFVFLMSMISGVV